MADNEGMFISDWDSARKLVQKHLQNLIIKDPVYPEVYQALLSILIVDIFALKEKYSPERYEEFIAKYMDLFRNGLGLNMTSLEDNNG